MLSSSRIGNADVTVDSPWKSVELMRASLSAVVDRDSNGGVADAIPAPDATLCLCAVCGGICATDDAGLDTT